MFCDVGDFTWVSCLSCTFDPTCLLGHLHLQISWLAEGYSQMDPAAESYVLRVQSNMFSKKEMKFWKFFCFCKTWSSEIGDYEDNVGAGPRFTWNVTKYLTDCGITSQKTEGQVLCTLATALHIIQPIFLELSASVREDPALKLTEVWWCYILVILKV